MLLLWRRIPVGRVFFFFFALFRHAFLYSFLLMCVCVRISRRRLRNVYAGCRWQEEKAIIRFTRSFFCCCHSFLLFFSTEKRHFISFYSWFVCKPNALRVEFASVAICICMPHHFSIQLHPCGPLYSIASRVRATRLYFCLYICSRSIRS